MLRAKDQRYRRFLLLPDRIEEAPAFFRLAIWLAAASMASEGIPTGFVSELSVGGRPDGMVIDNEWCVAGDYQELQGGQLHTRRVERVRSREFVELTDWVFV